MITSHFNRDTGIVETVFTGIVTFEDVVEYIHRLGNGDKYPGRLLILTDSIKGRFELTSEEDQKIGEAVRKYASQFEQIKDAPIINDPRTTAYSVLYRNATSNIPNYQFEIFSTREAAIKWLLG